MLGSFVPSWLASAIIGPCAAAPLRFTFKYAGISDQLLGPALTYIGIALAFTLLAWLLWFGH